MEETKTKLLAKMKNQQNKKINQLTISPQLQLPTLNKEWKFINQSNHYQKFYETII